MSEAHDKLPAVKLYESNIGRLRNYIRQTEEKTGVRTSLVNAANAAIKLGLPKLEKKSGVEWK